MKKKVLELSILDDGRLKADTKAMQKLNGEELTVIMHCLNDIRKEIERTLAGAGHGKSKRVLEYLIDEHGVSSSISKSEIEKMSLEKAVSLLDNMREDSQYIIALHSKGRKHVN